MEAKKKYKDVPIIRPVCLQDSLPDLLSNAINSLLNVKKVSQGQSEKVKMYMYVVT